MIPDLRPQSTPRKYSSSSDSDSDSEGVVVGAGGAPASASKKQVLPWNPPTAPGASSLPSSSPTIIASSSSSTDLSPDLPPKTPSIVENEDEGTGRRGERNDNIDSSAARSSVSFYIGGGTLLLVALLIAAAAVAYRANIESLLVVGGGFTARTLCSGLFVSKRPLHTLYENELAGLARTFFHARIDETEQEVTASFLGLGFYSTKAKFLGQALGCNLVRKHIVPPAFTPSTSPSIADFPSALNARVQELLSYEFTDHAQKDNQTRAIVVIHKGKLVGEGYARNLGINNTTRLLGWSMTKSVHALAVLSAISKGLLTMQTPVNLAEFPLEHRQALLNANKGKNVTFGDLLSMSDILPVDECYELTGDIPKMLYGEEDFALFATKSNTRKIQRSPFVSSSSSSNESSSSNFGWYYSSALSNVLAKKFRELFASQSDYFSFFFDDFLFRIGSSFTFESDTTGTLVASSYIYATAQDFARVGQLFLNGGSTQDGSHQLVAPDIIALASKPHESSGGHYGHAQNWLNPSCVSVSQYNKLPHSHKEKVRFRWMTQILPSDAIMLSGYLGQFVVIIPSLSLVVVRLGFTQADTPTASDVEHVSKSSFSRSRFFSSLLKALKLVKATKRKL